MNKELVCEKRDGYWFYSIFQYQGGALIKEAIIIDTKDNDRQIDYIKQKGIDKVIIDQWSGEIDSFDFIKDLPNIKYLVIWGNGKTDNTQPNNLKSSITMNAAKKYPNSGTSLYGKVPMRNPKMPGWLGWTKYQMSFDGNTVHYVGNRYFPKWYPFQMWYDFKLK